MSSPAQAIRHAVVEGLKAAGTRAEGRVFGNRTRPVWKDTTPVLLVYTREERSEVFQTSPTWNRRTLSLSIVTVDEDLGKAEDVIDDRLDELGQAVELFVFQDQTFGLGDQLTYPDENRSLSAVGGFLIESTLLDSVELVDFHPDERVPERPLAGQRITFQVRYRQPAPEGRTEDLEDFRGLNLNWKNKPGDVENMAADRVDLDGA